MSAEHACESCGRELHIGDRAHHTDDACWLCMDCSPTYGDMLDELVEHEALAVDEDAELTAEIREWIEAHIAEGGSLLDKAVTVIL